MKRILLIVFIFISTVLNGCSNNTSNDLVTSEEMHQGVGETLKESNVNDEKATVAMKSIKVEKRADSGYISINVLDSKEDIEKLEAFFEDKHWINNMEVQMATPPEYRFKLNDSNYAVWLTPLGDGLEIIREGEAMYMKLREQDSAILYELLTGEIFIGD